MTELFFSYLPKEYREQLLRDTGHFPKDFDPDAYLRRELPIQPHEIQSSILSSNTAKIVDVKPAR